MKKYKAILAAVIVVCGVQADGIPSNVTPVPEANPVAELVIQVTMPDGSPAVGVPVHEFALERYTIYNEERAWTDEKGLFKVSFQPGPHPDATHPLGYGVFRFLLKPDEFRWELSDVYCWAEFDRSRDVSGSIQNEGDHPDYQKWFEADNDGNWPNRDPASNWSFGKGVPVRRGDTLTWNVQLQPGKDVEVSAMDQFGEPIANARVQIVVDLGAHSHTGFGADITMRNVRTNASGKFTMEHCGDFSYQFHVSGRGWYYRPNEYCLHPYLAQNLARQGLVLRYQKPVRHDLTFVVVGSDGKPIPNVAVHDVLSFPSGVQGGGALGAMGEDGMLRFNDLIPLEHCVWFEFKAPGFADTSFMMDKYVSGEAIRVIMVPAQASAEDPKSTLPK